MEIKIGFSVMYGHSKELDIETHLILLMFLWTLNDNTRDMLRLL